MNILLRVTHRISKRINSKSALAAFGCQRSLYRPVNKSAATPKLTIHMASDAIKEQILSSTALQQLNRLFVSAGYEIRVAGGAVRDMMLGQQPKDIDLATTSLPEETLSLLKREGIRVVETGLQHGTVTAVIEAVPYEITTLRIDTHTDGRRAAVEFTNDWEADALRRDLTINAMTMDMQGNVYDYFQGKQHLAEHIVEFVGDASERILEDYLRILRYFRFHGRICPHDEHKSSQLEAIAAHAKGLESISGERIWTEMFKILPAARAAGLIRTMRATGVLTHVGLGEITDGHVLELERVRRCTECPTTLLATLVDSEAHLGHLAKRWRFPISERKLISFLLVHRSASLSDVIVEDLLVDGTPLRHVVCLLCYTGKTSLIAHAEQFPVPSFPLGGKDLLKAGVKQGKDVGREMKKLRDSWKASRFTKSSEQLLAELERNMSASSM